MATQWGGFCEKAEDGGGLGSKVEGSRGGEIADCEDCRVVDVREVQARTGAERCSNGFVPFSECGTWDVSVCHTDVQFWASDILEKEARLEEGELACLQARQGRHDMGVHFPNLMGPVQSEGDEGPEIADGAIGGNGGETPIRAHPGNFRC